VAPGWIVIELDGRRRRATPTVVLVHGAFGDCSGWRAVHDSLRSDGRKVLVPPTPLEGLASDARYLRALTRGLDGGVLLVGHSYGGAVATVAGIAENVVGLVYVAGLAPDEGETLCALQSRFPAPPARSQLERTETPNGTEVSIARRTFGEVFAADLTPDDAAFMAASQRPLPARALQEPASAAGWRRRKSWAVLPTADGAVHPDLHRFAFDRAKARVTEVPGASHAVMMSRPRLVAAVINEALLACQAIPL
jgi:pimeloyl-ACP methyl ester carboxylesterase